MAKTIVFDFDGVIHSYKSGWQGMGNIPDEPVEGIKEIIDKLMEKGYEVAIFSTRCGSLEGYEAVRKWLNKYGIKVSRLCATKPPAIVYVDDRAITFDGNCEGLVDKIEAFKSWIEKEGTK